MTVSAVVPLNFTHECAFTNPIRFCTDNAVPACRPTYRATDSGAIDTSPFDCCLPPTAALCESICEILSVFVCAPILSYYTNNVKYFSELFTNKRAHKYTHAPARVNFSRYFQNTAYTLEKLYRFSLDYGIKIC